MSDPLARLQPHPLGGFFPHGGTKYTPAPSGNYEPSIFSLENLNAATSGQFGSIVAAAVGALEAIKGATIGTKIVGKAIGALGVSIDVYGRINDDEGFIYQDSAAVYLNQSV